MNMDVLEKCSTVAFGVIAYNEHLYLPMLLDDLVNQTYPKQKIDVILVDGNSDDDTRQIMLDFQVRYSSVFRSIRVLDNPERVQPAGWNVVIKHFYSDILLRIDAHARLPQEFIQRNVDCINSGEYVCGGPRENIIDEDTPWKRTLLSAEQSLFGSGIASYRRETEGKKHVDSVFHGAYRKKVIDDVGLFNEKLIRTEDNEYHYRVRKYGYQICYDPDIKSFYQTRNTLPKMLKQKFENGKWIGKTLFICPGCISVFHLVPLCFILALIAGIVLCCFGVWQVLAVIMALYLIFVLMNTFASIIKSKNTMDLMLPMLFFLMHCWYGVGTLVGLI